MNYTKLLEQFDEKLPKNHNPFATDEQIRKCTCKTCKSKTFLINSHIQSLQQLYDELESDALSIKIDLTDYQISPNHPNSIVLQGRLKQIQDIQNKLTKEIEALQALMK